MTRNKKSPEKAQRNMNRFKNILFYTVLTLLLLSAIFTLVMIVVAPADRDLDEAFTKVKSDYILMFIQCLAAAGVLLLPSLLQHKFRIEIPNLMTIILVLFVFAAVYLGEVRSFYYRFAFWDKPPAHLQRRHAGSGQLFRSSDPARHGKNPSAGLSHRPVRVLLCHGGRRRVGDL